MAKQYSERAAEIIRLRREGILTRVQIAERVGVSRSYVNLVVKEAGLFGTSVNGRAAQCKPGRTYRREPSAISVRAVEMYLSGLTYGQVARKLGITRNAVAGACWRAGADKAEREENRGRQS